MEEWQRKRLEGQLMIVLMLLEKADSKGKTHGEKHHFHEVIEYLLTDVIREHCSVQSLIISHDGFDDPRDIPF